MLCMSSGSLPSLISGLRIEMPSEHSPASCARSSKVMMNLASRFSSLSLCVLGLEVAE